MVCEVLETEVDLAVMAYEHVKKPDFRQQFATVRYNTPWYATADERHHLLTAKWLIKLSFQRLSHWLHEWIHL